MGRFLLTRQVEHSSCQGEPSVKRASGRAIPAPRPIGPGKPRLVMPLLPSHGFRKETIRCWLLRPTGTREIKRRSRAPAGVLEGVVLEREKLRAVEGSGEGVAADDELQLVPRVHGDREILSREGRPLPVLDLVEAYPLLVWNGTEQVVVVRVLELRHALPTARLLLSDGYGRRLPGAVERLRLRPVDPHGHAERSLGGGQPVRLLLLARRLALDVDVERAVLVVLERHPGGDVVAVDGVLDEERLRVVHGQRPEGVRRR